MAPRHRRATEIDRARPSARDSAHERDGVIDEAVRGGEQILGTRGKDRERRTQRELVDDLGHGAVAAGRDDNAAARHGLRIGESRGALPRVPEHARRARQSRELARERGDAATVVGRAAVGIRGDDDHRRREYSGYASGLSTIASGFMPSVYCTWRTPSRRRSSPASTFIGPGLGAAPGAGCGNAVERAEWNVTLPSTFCST